MTSTASFKAKFKQAFSFFQWELKSCAGSLTIYSILTAVFMTVILTMCLVIGLQTGTTGTNEAYIGSNFGFNEIMESALSGENTYSGFALARVFFQVLSFDVIFLMTIIFTIIYTVKVFGYLHNKRQTDMYGSMPVSRITLFFSKSATAFIFSTVPALIFMGIASAISIILGQPLLYDSATMFLDIVLGSLACISAYGLIAVCCGTTIDSILMFIAVSIVYPISAYFVRGIMDSFYIGSSSEYLSGSFIMSALCPVSAYSGENVIYWLIFTIACLAGSAYLVRNRKAERAQSSFAYYLPCHIVKVLVSFLAGMFLGVLFGSFNVLGYGYAGFVFGFILASVSAFIVCHLIFYHGFNKLIKTSIVLGALIVVVVGAMAIVNFDVTGYNEYVPDVDQIESVGFIDSSVCYYNPEETDFDSLIKNSNSDFKDEESISTAVELHKLILENIDASSNGKFAMTWLNVVKSFVGSYLFDYDSFSYKLADGKTVTRKIDISFIDWDSSYEYTDDYSIYDYSEDYVDYYNADYAHFCELVDEFVCTKEYQLKYSAFINAGSDELSTLYICADQTDKDGDTTYYEYYLDETCGTNKYIEDRKKIMEAYKKDFEADTEDIDKALYYAGEYYYIDDYDDFTDYVCTINADYDYYYNGFYGYSYEELVVPESYTNTIQALKDAGILNADGTPNKSGKYVSYVYSDDDDYYDGL